MLVLIKKDDATTVPREVAEMAEARALAAQGMPVFLPGDEGVHTPIAAEEDAAEVDESDEKPAAKAVAKKTARK